MPRRACEIVTSFLASTQTLGPTTTSSSSSGGGISRSVQFQQQSNGGSADERPGTNVINMLTVEGREQVLLKVSVVEMERNIVKQFGIDLGTLINSGNFAFAALSDLPFPINAQGGGRNCAIHSQRRRRRDPGGLGTPSGVCHGRGRRRRPMDDRRQPRADACSALSRRTACCTPWPSRT